MTGFDGLDKLPTLKAAMELEGKHGNGLCFHWSAALCFDLPKSMVVIGVFEPDNGQIPLYHCWVECWGKVFAPTAFERLGGIEPMHREGYYNINRCTKTRRITREKLFKIFERNPAILLQLRHGIQPEKDGLLVDKLMKAANLSYRLTEIDGVVP